MTQDLRARVAAYQWHHSIDLGGGLVTPGRKSSAVCSAEAGVIFDRVDLQGHSVLDVGACNGYFSFEAKRRGAGRVLATDSYCWRHPEIRGRETFDLARGVLGADVETTEIAAAEMTPQAIGEFDVVLFLGVFYHCYDAIESLAKVARLAKHVLIVETHLDMRKVGRPAMAFYPGAEINGDSTNWWGPNELCMEALLRGHEFKTIETAVHPTYEHRAVFHAWRSLDLRRAPLPESSKLRSVILDRRAKIVRELRRPLRRWIG
jgi:tRNA (mo5U34)-methyltransferase